MASRTAAIKVDGAVKTGQFQFGIRNNAHGSPGQEVHDGDSVGLNTALNFGSRLLGIDAPEVSFTIRTKDTFVPIGNEKWISFWTSGAWKDMPLPPALLNHLIQRIGDGQAVAANHDKLAKEARGELKTMIEADMAASGKSKDNFLFFLAFSYEVLDQYARLLCYLNADRANFTPPNKPNTLSYNERMLATGAVAPYFIYPNIQPFLSIRPFDAAILAPTGFWKAINGAKRLQDARQAVAAARAAGTGIFKAVDPLILLPYEIRFIARKDSKGPDRYVIDLGHTGGSTLLKPEKYFHIQNLEDRLFIPSEFVALFQRNGWSVS